MTFNLTSRFSEGGREGRAGKRGVGRGTRYATLRAECRYRWPDWNSISARDGWEHGCSVSTGREGDPQSIDDDIREHIRRFAVFDASHAVPTAAENRPVNIAVPVILYLGLSA